MADDPNRKSPRTFQCRDYLWESFDEMSSELECSVDYLMNEAMRHYLRAQGRTPRGDGQQQPAGRGPAAPSIPSPANGVRTGGPPALPSANRSGAIPALPSTGRQGPPPLAGRPSTANMPALPPLPGGSGRTGSSAAIPSLPQRGGAPVQMPRLGGAGGPPPPPVPSRASSSGRTLYAVFGGEEFPVTKEEFFIGRGQKTCDLVIRDTNISRQHARVVQHNGGFWMVDNQSTNGVEFNGTKVDQKKIDDGDVYTICGHEIAFTYR